MDEILQDLITTLRSSSRLLQKRNIRNLWSILPKVCEINGAKVMVGDDAAAIRYGDEYLLVAAEGVYPPLLKANPYLAGRTSVLTNVNDIYAMGGRPLAIVDVLFATDLSEAGEVLKGIRDNAFRYGVPVIGGHFTEGEGISSLCVCIVGRARKLVSSFNAKAGDDLVLILNNKGRFYPGFNFWDSSGELGSKELIEQLELLPRIAEEGLADAGKDISMGGIIGSLLMLLESSGKGADIYIDRIPVPDEVTLKQWLLTFPSFGFVLSLRPKNTLKVKGECERMGLFCGQIGKVTLEQRVFFIDDKGNKELFWDIRHEPITGLGVQHVR